MDINDFNTKILAFQTERLDISKTISKLQGETYANCIYRFAAGTRQKDLNISEHYISKMYYAPWKEQSVKSFHK